jgi:arabinofuranan 3-O-arabinosyltransferase
VVASPGALARGAEVTARLCRSALDPRRASALRLHEGENAVTARSSPAFTLASIVLGQVGSSVPEPAPARIDSKGPASRVFEPGPDASVLNAKQNVNPGCTATQDGRDLDPVTIDGWQQGWELENDEQPVHAVFAPDRAYRAGLVVGAIAFAFLLVLVLLTRVRWRGPVPPAAPGRRVAAGLLASLTVVGAGLVAGWSGAVVALVLAPVVVVLQRRWPDVAGWILAAPCLAAATAYAVWPWGDPSGWAGNRAWPHYLMLVPLLGTLWSLLGSDGWRSPTWSPFRRRAGRSTTR